jgi:hypothetical protein
VEIEDLGTFWDGIVKELGQKLVWARNVQLLLGTQYNFSLTVPAGADYDFYLYNITGTAYGEPIIVANSTTAATGGFENSTYTPSLIGIVFGFTAQTILKNLRGLIL